MIRRFMHRTVPMVLLTMSCAMPSQATQFHFGVGTHLGQNKLNHQQAMGLYTLGGLTSIRDEAYWHRLEIEKGKIVFPKSLTELDLAITKISSAGGSPMVILNYNNMYYDEGDIPHSDEGIAAFSKYATYVANHFKGRVRLYEIWNEWNIGLGSNRKPRTIRPVSDYIRLLRSSMAAVRAVEPDVTIIAGAVANPDDKWIDEFIARGGLKGIDAFSVHPYVYQRPNKNRPEDAAEWLKTLDAKLTKANNGKPMDIYVTEIGWPNHHGHTGWTWTQTADFILRFHILARAQASIRGVWWYELRDGGDDPKEKEHRFGIVEKNLGAKPAFSALKTAMALLPEDAKVVITNPSPGAFKARISTGLEQCTAYWAREGEVSLQIPEGELVGRLLWGNRPRSQEGKPAVLNETPLITCKPGS